MAPGLFFQALPSLPSSFLPRSGACATVTKTGNVLLFGGYTENADQGMTREATNESLIYKPESSSWDALQCSTEGPSSAPEPRLTSQCVSTTEGKIWLIAGWNSNPGGGGFLNDLWCLDIDTAVWRQITPQGVQLESMSRHQAAAVGEWIYIHNHRCQDHILRLDTRQEPPRLENVQIAPDPQHGSPPSRGLHSMTLIGTTLHIFGGASQQGTMFNDLWQLDTAAPSLQWRKVQCTGGISPYARCSHVAAAVDSEALIVLGGAFYKPDGSGLECLDDAWLFDVEKKTWSKLALSGEIIPCARNAAVLVPLGEGKYLYHGGWLAFRQTFNDTCLVQIEK